MATGGGPTHQEGRLGPPRLSVDYLHVYVWTGLG